MKTFVTIKKLFLAIWIKTQSQKLAAKMNKMNVFGGFATKLNRNAEMIFCAFLEYMKKMKKITTNGTFSVYFWNIELTV